MSQGPSPKSARGGPADQGPVAYQGTIDLITYHDERSLYTVLKIIPEEGYDIPSGGELFGSTRITAVGKATDPAEGTRVRLWGQWGRHATHGSQFEFERMEALLPTDRKGLVRYLSSKAFSGIGEVTAGRIVDALGTNALTRIQEDANALDGIPGLRKEVAQGLQEALAQQMELHQAVAYLLGIGLGPLQARRVMERFGAETESLIRSDPYRLSDVTGIGFATADRMARASGIEELDPRRLQAGVLYSLDEASDQGHTCRPVLSLFEETVERLSLPMRYSLEATLEELVRQKRILVETRVVGVESNTDPSAHAYLPWLFHSEQKLAKNLCRKMAEKAKPLATAAKLKTAEAASGLELDPQQREAVLTLLAAPLALLTGGPGVGKTTIVQLLVSLAEDAGAKVELASPTGRAAKRLAEATGKSASTVHRLLGYAPGGAGFTRSDDDPLIADLVIVDEISMLDVVLAHHLLQAIGKGTRLILVGDPDQLPSVTAGNVLADLLGSGLIPTARLTHIFRQSASSLIVQNAHRLLAGQALEFPKKGDLESDFYFFQSPDAAGTRDLLVDVVTRRLKETFGVDWTTEVQVIAPMYKSECGVDELNNRLRDAQGVGGREVEMGNRRWRTGDRVIHTRNDYEREVFNGDMGRIVVVSTDGTVTVRFPEQDVVYSSGQLSDLQPAFAITVHRSQGGEFPVVVIPLVTAHWMMLRRNLLYTAITRAKQLLILVGSQQALDMALNNAEDRVRTSLLAERLEFLQGQAPSPNPG